MRTNPWESYTSPDLIRILSSISFVCPSLSFSRPASKRESHLPTSQVFSDLEGLPTTVKPRWLQTESEEQIEKTKAKCEITWLGHATTYLRIPSADSEVFLGVLMDPIFSKRCSPLSIGPQRRLGTVCEVKDLEEVDIVLISHDHYDHLDKQTIKDLNNHFPQANYMVPTGTKKWLVNWGVDPTQIREMTWWEDVNFTLRFSDRKISYRSEKSFAHSILKGDEEKELGVDGSRRERMTAENTLDYLAVMSSTVQTKGEKQRPPMGERTETVSGKDSAEVRPGTQRIDSEIAFVQSIDYLVSDPIKPIVDPTNSTEKLLKEEGISIRLVCTPAQHASGRGMWSKNKALWCSWLMEFENCSETKRVFFAGDTGYRSTSDGPTCPIFREIRETYGNPTLSLLPIANGSVLPYLESLIPFLRIDDDVTRHVHLTPQDAVDVHREMRSDLSIGVHWGTFTSSRRTQSTIKDLNDAKRLRDVNSFHVGDVGQTWEF
ncbi:hypothetical protein TREMEDRAFT_62255 [Tremella mesenterica DSM 1558]|uniref:uncharacterized protein n=1 Tax=Tremella mesenterica (strain ATCC 24925 / CBS 8224 / DSM 1558 / NBRC 9311 / NRRL Y-6157 / RJB 2259-6 / UBC 559-6) TaxID=578456 RepID=UPI0003F497AA|nr:uncharacterized protein TREMEDRAFT_62255 [Tremella mesenterica DSM 1558]EIW69391.1 hypothetical protein TREMEDRAFT_62255 [Tremella mesenterica DSM 1558]